MRKMLLSVLAVAAVSLSAGVASADSVCAPACTIVTPGEAQNMKVNQGKTNAGSHISLQGAARNNAGITQPSSGNNNNDSGGVIMISF